MIVVVDFLFPHTLPHLNGIICSLFNSNRGKSTMTVLYNPVKDIPVFNKQFGALS